MARFGIGWLGAVALTVIACAGSTRSVKAGSGASAATEAADETKASGTSRPAAGSGGATSSGGPTRQVVGRVELLDRGNELTLSGTERVGLAFEKLKIDAGTQITLPDGERATVADVSPGDEVRASFSGTGADAHLQRLEILPSGE